MSSRQSMPSRLAIFNHWKDWLLKRGIDINKPCCWACMRPVPSKKTGTIAQMWSTAQGLQRAHIVADSLGGLATPDNFFLLCRGCHGKAPSSGNKDLFLTWATRQDWQSDLASSVDAIVDFLAPFPGERSAFMMWLHDLTPDKIHMAMKGLEERSALHLGYPDSQSSLVTDLIGSLYHEFAQSKKGAFDVLLGRYPPKTFWEDSEDERQPDWTQSAQHKYTNELGEDWYARIDTERRVVLLTGVDIGWSTLTILRESIDEGTAFWDNQLCLDRLENRWLDGVLNTARLVFRNADLVAASRPPIRQE